MSVTVTVGCAVCRVSFDSARDLIEHNEAVHAVRTVVPEGGTMAKDQFPCRRPGCESVLSTAASRMAHEYKQHGGSLGPGRGRRDTGRASAGGAARGSGTRASEPSRPAGAVSRTEVAPAVPEDDTPEDPSGDAGSSPAPRSEHGHTIGGGTIQTVLGEFEVRLIAFRTVGMEFVVQAEVEPA